MFTEEDFKSNFEKVNLMNQVDELNKKRDEVSAKINKILAANGITETITKDDIVFTDNFLKDENIVTQIDSENCVITQKRKLSDIVFDYYFEPRKPSTYYHYTTFQSFKKIVESKQLILYSLLKRFKEDEYTLFYKDHNLPGYNSRLKEDKSSSKNILKNTFYFSFSDSSKISVADEAHMWEVFGDEGYGIRLEFEIDPDFPDLRNIFYQSNAAEKASLLFNQLSDFANTEYNKKILISGLSKIGCFYLRGEYKLENEVRLLVKQPTDQYSFDFEIHQTHDKLSYIKLNFDNPLVQIKLKSVQPGANTPHNKVPEILSKHFHVNTPEIREKPN